MPHIIPIRDLKNTVAVSQLCHDSEEPIFVTKNGYGDMVIMSMDTYEKKIMMADIYRCLHEAEEDFQQGMAREAHEVLNELKKTYGLSY